MGENIRLAFRQIGNHKMRSFLAMLGIIVGIASIIAASAMVKGAEEQLQKSRTGAGTNTVTVSLCREDSVYDMSMGLPQGVSAVSDDQKERIRTLSNVRDATFYYERSSMESVVCGDRTLDSATVLGIDSHYLNTVGAVVFRGRKFTDAEFETPKKVALLDRTAADTLCPGGTAVGSTVEIEGDPYVVVGVIRPAKEYQPVINTYQDYEKYYGDDTGTVYIPESAWPIGFSFDEPQNAVARADRAQNVSGVGERTASILNESLKEASDSLQYQTDFPEASGGSGQKVSGRARIALILIAVFSILIGGIGVMNNLLASVEGRIREIGLRRILGAKKTDIFHQFLTESAVLTGLGGVIGAAAGIFLSRVLFQVAGIPVSVSISSVLINILVSVLVGVLFGIFPAARAARTDPAGITKHYRKES
jgi:putative ABC transport system permease protein